MAPTKETAPLDRKKCLILKGRQSSEIVNRFLRDVGLLLKPHVVKFERKNDINLFEGGAVGAGIESFCTRSDCGLFVFGSHSKKRPHNIVFGRIWNGQVLDMVEFGLSPDTSALTSNSGLAVHATPLLVFTGAGWEADSDLREAKDVFIDMFHGVEIEKIGLLSKETRVTGRGGIERAIVFSAPAPDAGASLNPIRQVFIRAYHVEHSGEAHETFRGSDGKPVPKVNVEETGMASTFTLRRTAWCTDARTKRAARARPRASTRDNLRVGESVPIAKSVRRDITGTVTGRVFPEQQNLDDLAVKRFKAFKRSRQEKKGPAAGAARAAPTNAGDEN